MFKLVCTYITQLKEYDIICLCHDDNLLFRIREYIWIKCKPELHLHNPHASLEVVDKYQQT